MKRACVSLALVAFVVAQGCVVRARPAVAHPGPVVVARPVVVTHPVVVVR